MSDVMGSILLVGITVVMAGGFGAVLLSYDGPQDQVHTHLSASVGPGADGIWGTNAAELEIHHLGGEGLDEADVRVTYVDTLGSHTVTPAFTGDVLRLGDTWIQVISASPGFPVDVTVVVDQGTRTAVVSQGTVEAGGSSAALKYVVAITPAAGKGSVDVLAPAQDDGDVNAASTLTEGSVGGAASSGVRSASTANNNGASNNNVLLSDDVRSVLNDAGDWVQGAGFTPGSGINVADIQLGMEVRATQYTSTIAHVQTVSQTSLSGSVSVSVTAAAGNTYILAVAARGALATPNVSSIGGTLTGLTWTSVGAVNGASGFGRTEVFIGTGTATSGTVVVNFNSAITGAVAGVSRYTGVDATSTTSTYQAVQTNIGSTNTVTGTTVAGTATTGRFFVAVNGMATGTIAFTSPPEASGQRLDQDAGGVVQLGIADMASSATNQLSATLTATPSWQAVSIQLRPYTTPLPTATLSYTLTVGGLPVTGATTLAQPLTCAACTYSTASTSGTDASYQVSVVGDRAWTLANIADVAVRVTYATDTGSDVEVDLVYLYVTVTTTPTTFNTQIDLSFTGVTNLPTQVFQMRYKVSGDTFRVYAMTGATPRLCPGTLASAAFAVFTCTLTTAEYNGGAPILRVKDVTPSGTLEGKLFVEYARMSSS